MARGPVAGAEDGAVLYYPVMQRTSVRSQRTKNIARTTNIAAPLDDDDQPVDQLDVTLEDPSEDMREHVAKIRENPRTGTRTRRRKRREEEEQTAERARAVAAATAAAAAEPVAVAGGKTPRTRMRRPRTPSPWPGTAGSAPRPRWRQTAGGRPMMKPRKMPRGTRSSRTFLWGCARAVCVDEP